MAMTDIPSDDVLPIEIDIPTDDAGLPAWVATLLVAIGAIVPIPADVAFTALRALLAPYASGGALRATFEALPQATRRAIRASYDAKHAEIERERARNASGPNTRQAIPVVRSVPQAPEALPVLTGTWTRIQAGPHTGEWGARIENVQGLQVGRLVRLYKRGATRGSLHAVTAFGMRDGAAICAVRDATDDERAIARNGGSVTPSDGVPVVEASQAETSGPIVTTLGPSDEMVDAMQALIANNERNAERRARAAETIEGALVETANQGTTLATHERAIEPSSETVDVNDRTFAAGTTSTPVGPSYFDRPRSERTGFQVQASQTSRDVRGLLGEREFIAGAVASGSMLQVSWTGGGSTTAPSVFDALQTIGRESDAPEGKSTVAYAGDAVDSMKNREYDTYRAPNGTLPQGVKARWIVGRKLSRATVNAGDEYGTVLLRVDLKSDDTLAFDGDATIAASIRTRYAADLAKSTLKSDTLTAWLGRVLRIRHGAVKRGHVWYVPGGQADAARALIDAISPLWGDHEHIPVTTGPDLFRSLTRGLLCEAQAIADDFSNATALAKQRARANAEKTARALHNATEAYVVQESDRAFATATISNTVAARLLTDLGKVAARVMGYETMLGSEAVQNAKSMIADLRRSFERLTDDTSARAAMLELD